MHLLLMVPVGVHAHCQGCGVGGGQRCPSFRDSTQTNNAIAHSTGHAHPRPALLLHAWSLTRRCLRWASYTHPRCRHAKAGRKQAGKGACKQHNVPLTHCCSAGSPLHGKQTSLATGSVMLVQDAWTMGDGDGSACLSCSHQQTNTPSSEAARPTTSRRRACVFYFVFLLWSGLSYLN